MSSTLSPPDASLLAWYDALDEDPPGHRLEVLEGSLVVTPSPSSEHQDRARGLANVLDEALAQTAWEVREDLESRLEHPVKGLGSRPRADVSVLDPTDPDGVRLLTVEVVSASDNERVVPGRPETRREAKRRIYAYGGVRGHLEVEEVGGAVEVRAFVARGGVLAPAGSARGDQTLTLSEPVPLRLVPDELAGWLRRRLADLHERAEAERARAEAERARADRAEDALRRLRSGKGAV